MRAVTRKDPCFLAITEWAQIEIEGQDAATYSVTVNNTCIVYMCR